MYDELVKRLRDIASLDWNGGDGEYVERAVKEAADAIEELQADNTALNGTVSNLIQQIEELGKPRWIPVTERLPKYGETVLVYGSQGGIYTARYERARTEWGRDSWWKLNSKSHICNPTHWMPLPQPPKEE